MVLVRSGETRKEQEVHLALLKCGTLYYKLVPGSLVCPYLVEHLLELDKVQLVLSLW